VIVQGASAKLRVGYHPRTAIMLSLREYAVPIISGVLTTIVVFIPMMTLPGVLGKFLAYIPITIFGVLATGLVLALTVNSALYILMMKKRDTYIDDENALEYADADAKSILETERIGKTYISGGNSGLRLRAIHAVTTWYKNILRKFLESTYLRRISIFLPFVFFLVGILFIAPRVGFDLFPGDDQGFFSIKIV
jgi:multidrug efflux pump subunit AcrB